MIDILMIYLQTWITKTTVSSEIPNEASYEVPRRRKDITPGDVALAATQGVSIKIYRVLQ